MKRSRFLLLFAALIGISAGPAQPPDDLVRRANEAVAGGDLEAAESLYAQAEERSPDPGLVAFNTGTLLYRRADYRRAELCFRRTLGDAAIPRERRGKGLFNLGNCLVKQGETDLRQLQAAIDCFELALREPLEEGIRRDAEHNLELTKLLWAKARAKNPDKEHDPEWDNPREKEPPPDPKKPPEPQGKDGANENASKLDPAVKIDPGKGQDKGVATKETAKPVPGQGNLPVLPDTEEVPSRSTDDARAFLKKAADRLQRERQKLREEAVQGERIRANDW
jgi:hypothetical protein